MIIEYCAHYSRPAWRSATRGSLFLFSLLADPRGRTASRQMSSQASPFYIKGRLLGSGPNTPCRKAGKENVLSRRMYKQYLLWMSKEESDALDDLSARSGLSKANVLRKFILSKPIKERPSVDFLELENEIYQIGNNFNQLVRRANRLGTVSDNDIKEAQRVYNRVHRLLREWEKTWR